MQARSLITATWIASALVLCPLVANATGTAHPSATGGNKSTTTIGPSTNEQIATYSLTGTALLASILVSPPDHPRWTQPFGYETAVRDALRWSNVRSAKWTSLAWTSSVLASGLVTPLASRHRYDYVLGLQLQALALTQLTTTALKATVARQRPYARFGTREVRSLDANASFPSADTSWSFAMATSSAYLLAREHPKQAPWIWTTAIAAAGTAGYLRIAADYHYVTDVVVGASIGTTFGLLVPMLQVDHYFGPRHAARRGSSVTWTVAPGPSLTGISAIGSF